MSLFKRKINESEAALAELQASFASVQSELDSVRTELKDAQELAATYQAEFVRVDAENKEHIAKIGSLETELAEASRDAVEFDDKVAAKAASEIASIGHAPLEIVEEEEPTDILTTFKGLKGRELQEFYNANKKEIAAALRKGA